MILFCVFWIAKGFYTDSEFNHNFKITSGQVNRVTNVLRQSDNRNIEFEYYVNGEKIVRNNIIHLCSNLTDEKLRQLLINKSFPVAYDLKDADVSSIILTSEDAHNFDYKISDSLLICDSILTCK